MNKFLYVVAACLTLASTNSFANEAIVNGKLSESQISEASRFEGTFSAEDDSLFSPVAGTVTVSLGNDGRLRMTSTMDITGEASCHSAILQPVSMEATDLNLFGDHLNAVEVYFQLDKGNCPEIESSYVTLHYNKAITGKSIFQVSVVWNPGETDEYRGSNTGSRVKVWNLTRE